MPIKPGWVVSGSRPNSPAEIAQVSIMFVVVRSVFWLTLAYLVIKPGVDMPDGGAIAAQAVAAGKQVVAEQVSAIECNSLECIGGKAVAAAVLQPTPASARATADAPVSSTAPYPRPRPNRAG